MNSFRNQAVDEGAAIGVILNVISSMVAAVFFHLINVFQRKIGCTVITIMRCWLVAYFLSSISSQSPYHAHHHDQSAVCPWLRRRANDRPRNIQRNFRKLGIFLRVVLWKKSSDCFYKNNLFSVSSF